MAHPDLDALLNTLYPAAQDLLAEHGEFYPFGASMTPQGDITLAGGHTGQEQPASQAVIDLLEAGFRPRAARGEVRAAGICSNVRVVPPGGSVAVDALHAHLERTGGESVDVFLPYRRDTSGGIEYLDLFAQPGTRKIF